MTLKATLVSADDDGGSWHVSKDIETQLSVSDAHAQKLLRKITKCFHRLDRPTFIGPIAVEVGVSIRQLHVLIMILTDAGDIKKLTSRSELKKLGIDSEQDPEVYMLTARAKAWLAHD